MNRRSLKELMFMVFLTVVATVGALCMETCLEELMGLSLVGVPLFRYFLGFQGSLSFAVGGSSFIAFFFPVSLCIMMMALFLLYDLHLTCKE